MYSNEEVLIKITRKLEDNDIIFEINRNNKSIDLFFDTKFFMDLKATTKLLNN